MLVFKQSLSLVSFAINHQTLVRSLDLFTERKACWENGGDLETSTARSFEFRQVLRCLFLQQTSLHKHEQRY